MTLHGQSVAKQMKQFSRRIFLKTGASAIGFFFVFLWGKISLKHQKFLAKGTIVLPLNKNREVSFENDFLIVNKNETPTVFSSHCTHLGCTINKMEEGRLVCPCHGSEFDLEGHALKGPAYRPLKKIEAKISSDGTQLQIEA